MCTLSTSKSLCTSTHGTAQIVIEDTNDLDLSALYFLAFIPKQHPIRGYSVAWWASEKNEKTMGTEGVKIWQKKVQKVQREKGEKV